MISLSKIASVGASLFALNVVAAQCPDGSPPPCDTRRSAALQVIPQRAAAPPSAADRSRHFLILPFRNVTKQAAQDWLIEGSTTMLVEALERWQGITVVPDEKLYPALKRAGITPGTVPDPVLVRRVAEQTGGWTAISGEVLNTGGRLRISARAWDVPTSKELVRASSEISSGGDVRAAFDSVSLKLLKSAGFDVVSSTIASSTTHNLDAYRSYLSGLAHIRRAEVKAALKEFQDAVRMDSTFALAWARLAEATINSDPNAIMNPQSDAAKYSARAVALSGTLSPRDRQLVLAENASFQAHFTEARRILEGLVAADSNDFDAATHLIALEMFDPILVAVPGGQRPRGSLNRAARLAKRTVSLDASRNQLFGLLASIYAQAGVPGATPVLGIDRDPTSYPDLMQIVRQREHLRLYSRVLRDSIELVPAESLSVIPKDSIKSMQKAARAAAKMWADRWIAAAGDESAPYVVAAELHSLDHEYPEALAALAKADSLGVQTVISVPARRMLYLARSGALAAATRIADSLSAANFFANANNQLVNGDAMTWSFALQTMSTRTSSVAKLLEQSGNLWRVRGVPTPESIAFESLMGNDDPEEEPGIPRSLRIAQLDSITTHISEWAASPQLSLWLPEMLPMLAEIGDTTKRRNAMLLKTADAIAATGKPQLAIYLASNAVGADSTLAPEAAKLAWYVPAAEANNAVKRAAAARFHPGTATVSADRAVFEWVVDDSAPFAVNRAETPPDQGEYRWEVTVNIPGRYYRILAAARPRSAVATPTTQTLSEILGPAAQRAVITGALAGTIRKDTTNLANVPVRTEIAPRVLRMIITDKSVLNAWLAAKPAEARFKFLPCVRPVGLVAPAQCTEGVVRITYP